MLTKPLLQFPDYTITNTGIITNTITKQQVFARKETSGYRVPFNIKGRTITANLLKLLANTFLPDTPTRYVIPIDGDVYNISISNLMYGRTKETLKYLKANAIGNGTLSKETLSAMFYYTPATGIFIRKLTGQAVGYLTGKKTSQYLTVEIGGKPYKLHRLAFLYMLDYLPEYVDHIDHNTLNNSWSNLREVTSQINSKNRSFKGNSTGIMGVTKTRYGNYLARITTNYKCLSLGTYKTLEEAVEVRKQAEITYNFHSNHGK